MTSLCGWLHTAIDDSLAEPTLNNMIQGLQSTGIFQIRRPGVACAATNLSALPDGLMVAIVGKPYWSNLELARLASKSHTDALAEAYRRYTTGLFEYLQGAFSLVVLDPAARRMIAAIDRIGQQHFYYATPPQGIVFGSTTDSVRAHPEVSSRLSDQGLFNYLYFHMLPSPGSIYADQHKLPGAHYLDYQDGRLQVIRYWQPGFTETLSASVDALGEAMRALILEAVRRVSPAPPVGAFLSGGLDSSTVAGMLTQIYPGQVKTYSIGFAVQGYDEMAYARLASAHFGTEQREYYVTPDDAMAMIPKIAQAYDEPFGNSSALPVYYCARLAGQDGLQALLAGDGGDELFAGNKRYADQQVFDAYQKIPYFTRHYLIEASLKHLPSLSKLALFRKANSYIQQANTPLPDRLESYNFLHRHTAQEVFSAEFLAAIDVHYPLALLREIYAAPASASPLNRMLYLDWHQTLHDNDLVKVNRMCQLAGIQVIYPLLDDRLVEFSCRLPSSLKLKGQRLRWFYKQAMRGFLPKQTIRKSKHGFGLPFGLWIRSHQGLQELAYDSLQRLKQRHYLRPAFLDRAIELHRSDHAAYYGELIWILMMLSLWLEQHGL